MSRSGYEDDGEYIWGMIRWRGQVASAMKGKRGQKLLVDLLAAMDAMPNKRLIIDVLQNAEGEMCALGCVANFRKVDVSDIDPYEDADKLAERLDIAEPLVREIEFVNDELFYRATPEERWHLVRKWVENKIKKAEKKPSE